jgi:hypothetical protein
MKKYSWIFLLILLPVLSYSQSDTIAFKGCNTISVQYTGNADTIFKAVVNTLLDKGYTIEKTEMTFHTAQTAVSRIGNFSICQKIYIRVSGTAVELCTRSNYLDKDYFADKIAFGGNPRSIFMTGWSRLEEIASQVKGRRTYLIN